MNDDTTSPTEIPVQKGGATIYVILFTLELVKIGSVMQPLEQELEGRAGGSRIRLSLPFAQMFD